MATKVANILLIIKYYLSNNDIFNINLGIEFTYAVKKSP